MKLLHFFNQTKKERLAAELAFPPTPQKSAASIIHRGSLSGKSDTFRKEKHAERIWTGE